MVWVSNAIAAGMLAASWSLIEEGLNHATRPSSRVHHDSNSVTLQVVVGLLLGCVFVVASKRFLDEYEDSNSLILETRRKPSSSR